MTGVGDWSRLCKSLKRTSILPKAKKYSLSAEQFPKEWTLSKQTIMARQREGEGNGEGIEGRGRRLLILLPGYGKSSAEFNQTFAKKQQTTVTLKSVLPMYREKTDTDNFSVTCAVFIHYHNLCRDGKLVYSLSPTQSINEL